MKPITSNFAIDPTRPPKTFSIGLNSNQSFLQTSLPVGDLLIYDSRIQVKVSLQNFLCPHKFYNVKDGCTMTLNENGVLRTITLPKGNYLIDDSEPRQDMVNDIAFVMATLLGGTYTFSLCVDNPAYFAKLYIFTNVANRSIVSCSPNMCKVIGFDRAQEGISLTVGTRIYMQNSYNLCPTKYLGIYSSLTSNSSVENYYQNMILNNKFYPETTSNKENLLGYVPIDNYGFNDLIVSKENQINYSLVRLDLLSNFWIEILDEFDDPIDLESGTWSLILFCEIY